MSQQLVTRESGAMSITTEERSAAHEALDKMMDGGIVASTADPNVAAALMEYAMRRHILLTEALGAFRLRPGWELAFTKLPVNTSKEAKLVYAVSNFDDGGGGREWGDSTPLGFHRPLLQMIRTHLGINVDSIERVDDRAKPYLWEYQIKGHYLGIDGQVRTLVNHGGIDLSEGSETCKKIYSETRGANEQERRKKADETIARMRSKGLQRATTNAEERLITGYGFRGSYTKGELDNKLIVCVRPIRTGYHPNPEVQKMLIEQMMREETMARGILYGASAPPPPSPALPASISAEAFYPQNTSALNAAGDATGENGAGQGDVAGDQNASIQGQETQSQPKQQHCTVESGCLGLEEGRKHVMACYGKGEAEAKTEVVEQSQSGQTEERPWVLQQGPARNLPVNDPKVTVATLVQMEHELAAAISPKGLLYDQLSDEKKDLLSQELRKIGEELNRRKITQGRLAR